MTTVHISLVRDDGTDQTPARGVVEWQPTARREDGTDVILPRGFTAPLVAGEATVTVDPSGLTWCWRVTERTDSGGVVRYVSVPDSATAVEYVDLPDVDPDTLLPWAPADPEAAYQLALDNLDMAAAVAAYLLANPVSAPVSSVNGKVGAVTLDADDVGADPAGTAAGLVGALAIPDSADDVGAIPEPAVEGASGDVLTTDGAGGRTWATPDAGGVTSGGGGVWPQVVSGSWYNPPLLATPIGSAWPIINRGYLSPMFFATATTITAIAVFVSAAGAAANVVRLGVYRDSSGVPGAITEQGTVAGDSTGYKTLTLSSPVSVAAGELVWLAAAPQGTGAPGSTWLSAPAFRWGRTSDTGATWVGEHKTAVAFFSSSGAFTNSPAVAIETADRFPCLGVRVG